MTAYSAIQTSYNGGELSRRMEGRVDTAIYQIGTAEMENFVPTVEGPAVKRPGYRFIREAMASTSWLSPFIFSATQAYVIEWGEAALRFYTNGGRIEDGAGAPYEVAVPYTAAEARRVSQQQSYDRLYLAHGRHKPASLLRTGATTFVHAALTLKDGPFADQNIDKAVTVTASGTTGIVTLTASAPIFKAGHVGAPFMIEALDFSDVPAWEVGIDSITVGMLRRSDNKVYTAASAGRTGTAQPIHTSGTEWDGSSIGKDVNDKGPYGVQWTYRHDRFGLGTITAIGPGGTTATLNVTRRLPDSVTSVPTHRWAHSMFSEEAGWPNLVLLAWGRLVYFTDFHIVASVAGDYGGGTVNFATHTASGLLAPDMAFTRRLSISDPVIWAREDRGAIIIGTTSGEYAIRRINNAQPATSDNIECIRQTRYGCAEVWPVEAGAELIFAQAGARKLRLADYDFARDRYAAENLTVWSRHILAPGAVQLAFEQNPEEMLWAVRGDGQMAVHPHAPEQEIKGFARVRLAAGGRALSTIAIPTEDGSAHEQWALVERDGFRSVEQRAPWWEEGATVEDAFFVDSGVTIENPASQHITGATWLAGKAVQVLADGSVVPNIVVGADGSFDLPFLPKKVHVGLGYQARLKNLRPEIQTRNGTLQGKRKRFVSIVLRLLDTLGIKVDPGTGRPEQLLDRSFEDTMDGPESLFSGDTSGKSIGGNWERDGQGTIISDDPLPCVVLAMMPKLEVTE